MSFSIHLVCAREGEKATFKRALFDEIMGREAINPKFPLYQVDYHDGGCWDIRDPFVDQGETSMISFSRFDGNTFFDLLWEFADKVGAFMFWPGEGRLIAVTNREVLAQLPGELKNMGPPYIVKNGRELFDAICGIDPEALP